MLQLPQMGYLAEVLKEREVGISLQQLELLVWKREVYVQGIGRQTNKVAVVLLQGSCKITVKKKKKVILASLKMCPWQSA